VKITMQDVRERCYDIDHLTIQVMGYIELGHLEKATEIAKKVREIAVKTLFDATEAAKGTPDYRREPYKLLEHKLAKRKPAVRRARARSKAATRRKEGRMKRTGVTR
jgi:hypothetical protein